MSASQQLLLGGKKAEEANYIEDVFQTWLYTGNGSTQTINNGIDLAGKGGLVWTGRRTTVNRNTIYDTARTLGGFPAELRTYLTDAQAASGSISSFNSNGYSLTADIDNTSGASFASWTFRKQPKFFDCVTYTGDGVDGRAISHSLGSTPGCVIVKRTDTTSNWFVNHFDAANATERYLFLNSTSQADTATILAGGYVSNSSSTVFRTYDFGTGMANVNASGGTYVAYLFAHNAGGFGLTGTDNVISCGSFTTDGSGYIPTVNLGYEPQWILAKPSSGTGNWFIMDNMRGWYNQQADQGNALFPNTSGAEAVGYNAMIPTATGFTGPAVNFGAGITYIYIAIRRGPMRTPTTGTSVFSPVAYTGTGATNIKTDPNFPPDLVFGKRRAGAEDVAWLSRLTGTNILASNSTVAQSDYGTFGLYNMNNVGYTLGTNTILNGSGSTYVNYVAQRAPGFFDEVCYTGTGTSGTAIPHNLGVAPELVISKARSTTNNWLVWATALGDQTSGLLLNTADATQTVWASGSSPTSSNVYINYNVAGNSGQTYVAYLFATCPGVSKVGSYTGNGSSQTINCGFAAGARFVMIKRTDTAGYGWCVFDTARGITSGDDAVLFLNSTAAEQFNGDWIDPASSGFAVTNYADVNASGGTYIFLAIA